MSWNYRIVRYKDASGFGLHEVYYDKGGFPYSMTADAVRFTCGPDEGPEGITERLMMARTDARKRPVFDEPDEWPGHVA